MKEIRDYIRTIPDFPHEGILFRDVTTLFADPRGFRMAVDRMLHPYADVAISHVAGLEARGFILGGAIAHQLSVGFVPIRKKGKLPGATIEQDYTLEYATATVELHDDALGPGDRVLLVDDLLATGGTAWPLAPACLPALLRSAGTASRLTWRRVFAGPAERAQQRPLCPSPSPPTAAGLQALPPGRRSCPPPAQQVGSAWMPRLLCLQGRRRRCGRRLRTPTVGAPRAWQRDHCPCPTSRSPQVIPWRIRAWTATGSRLGPSRTGPWPSLR